MCEGASVSDQSRLLRRLPSVASRFHPAQPIEDGDVCASFPPITNSPARVRDVLCWGDVPNLVAVDYPQKERL